MTGYGASVKSSANYKITVELKSLNSKYMELNLRLPRVYMKYENEIRNLLSRKLVRGKVVALINIEILSEGTRSLNINRALLKSYIDELNRIKSDFSIGGEIDLPFLVTLPEVIPSEILQEDEEEWNLIRSAMEEATGKLVQSRKDEGQALAKDLIDRQSAITEALEGIKVLAPRRLENVRSRIDKALDEIRNKVMEFDTNRYEQEIVFYLEKMDINEEIVRLDQHLKYFAELSSKKNSNGKKLQFLSQEMGREINTIGSKANDAEIQRLVVTMKDELEKIKEQVLNIL